MKTKFILKYFVNDCATRKTSKKIFEPMTDLKVLGKYKKLFIILMRVSFLMNGKKANFVPVHKKGNKQKIKNYRSISLLPICSRKFERLIYSDIFNFFSEKNLISPNQEGFRPWDSCVNELFAINHKIYKSSDDGFP